VNYGRNARLWMRKCVMLLPEIEKRLIWRAKGFGSIYEYAAKLAGMNHETVNDALRILEKISDKPELLKIAEQKGINAVRPVATIATRETEKFWAEKAVSMSKNTLETYVRELRTSTDFQITTENNEDVNLFMSQNGGELGGSGKVDGQMSGFAFDLKTETGGLRADGGEAGCGKAGSQLSPATSLDDRIGSESTAHKKIVAMELEPEVLEQLEKLKGRGGWNELMKQLLHMRAVQLEEQKPEAKKTESRHIPAKIQRYVFARTNGACAFPGCTKSTKIKHHTQRFALEKVHDPDRLHGLCKEHERIAHLGLIENEHSSTQNWKLRLTPDKALPAHQIDEIVRAYRTPR